MCPFFLFYFLQFYKEQQFSGKIMFEMMHITVEDKGKVYFTSNKGMHNIYSSWNVDFDFYYVM